MSNLNQNMQDHHKSLKVAFRIKKKYLQNLENFYSIKLYKMLYEK